LTVSLSFATVGYLITRRRGKSDFRMSESNTENIDDLLEDDVALLVIASVRDEKWILVVETLNQQALSLTRQGT